MRFLTRLSVIALMLALLSAGSPSVVPKALAADSCFGLAAPDCALLHDSEKLAALRSLSSFQLDYDLALNIQGNRPELTLDFSAKGSGPFHVDGDALSKFAQGDPAAVASGLLLANTTSATAVYAGTTVNGTVELRIVNETLYVQGDTLTQGKWKSVGLKTVSESAQVRKLGAGDLLRVARVLIALNRLQAAPGLMTIGRVGDLSLDNQTMAVFVYKIDLQKLFGAPDFVQLVKLGLEIGGEKVNEDDIKELASILAAYTRETQFTLTRLVGTRDRLPHGIGFSLVGQFDPSTFIPLEGGGSPQGSSAKPIQISASFMAKMTGIGNKVIVAAPVGAEPIDLGTLVPAATPSR